MTKHKHTDKICIFILVFSVVLTVLFMNASAFGVKAMSLEKGYEKLLFDTSKVHTINIIIDDWDDFIEGCTDEAYKSCSVVIDNEAFKNVAIRAKGNTSLSNVANYGNDRYSFKIEFDHYDKGKTYYGLDKLSLNNIIQDNTYMKDYITYRMMHEFDVYAPLTSYAQILVNGEEWGLYLAVEGVEDSFLQRNFGNDYGNLYKPDNSDMGGGKGKGGNFNMEEWGERPEKGDKPGGFGGPGNTSPDISLIYSDDEIESYKNIFDNAKTEVTDADKKRLIASIKALNEYNPDDDNIEETVNVEEVIRYFVVHNFVCNFDSYTGSMIHNYYLYEDDGVLSMIPWDYNLAFGGFEKGAESATGLVNFPIDDPVSGGTTDSRPMLSWIFENEEYTELYHQYFSEFVSKYYDNGYFSEWIDDTYEMIAPYVKSDPTSFCEYDEFEKGVETLKSFCLLRFESVSGQLEGTISATSAGQDDDTLVDASDINISDMGNMGNHGGPGGQGGFGEQGEPGNHRGPGEQGGFGNRGEPLEQGGFGNRGEPGNQERPENKGEPGSKGGPGFPGQESGFAPGDMPDFEPGKGFAPDKGFEF